MIRSRRRTVLTIIALLPWLAAAVPAAAQKVETVDGVRVVHNIKGGLWGNAPQARPRARPQDRRRRHRGRARRLQLSVRRRDGQGHGQHLYPRHRQHPHPEVRSRRRVPGHGRPQGPGAGRVHHARQARHRPRRQPRRRRYGPVAAPRHHRRREGRAGHHPQGRAPLRRPMPGRRRLRRPGLDLGLPDARPGRPEDRRHAPVPAPGAGRADHGLVRDADRFRGDHDQRRRQHHRDRRRPRGRAARDLHRPEPGREVRPRRPSPLAGRPASRLRHGGQEEGQVRHLGGGVSMSAPEMNTCSAGIAVDAKGRSWVLTYARQLKKEEQVQTSMMSVGGQAGVSNVSIKTDGEHGPAHDRRPPARRLRSGRRPPRRDPAHPLRRRPPHRRGQPLPHRPRARRHGLPVPDRGEIGSRGDVVEMKG
ncbi:MAG: hypothetical protein MZV63_66130 [Marinilabiliales bacterium]|nr:hypothetical protein [Marinilabiliales bacterium]